MVFHHRILQLCAGRWHDMSTLDNDGQEIRINIVQFGSQHAQYWILSRRVSLPFTLNGKSQSWSIPLSCWFLLPLCLVGLEDLEIAQAKR